MSSGTFLSDFADFVEATGSTYVNTPDDIVNEAVKNTYFFGRLVRGDIANQKKLQGGKDINNSIFFDDGGNFETYLPGQSTQWKNPQVLDKVTINWRFTKTHMSWTEQEILPNERIRYGTREAMFHQFVNLRNEKEAVMWTGKWNGLENLLWAAPNRVQMETADGTEPYSIWVFINEETNGIPLEPSDSTAWTVVEGLNPATIADSKWVPQQLTYSSSAANNSGNIVSTFDNMDMLVRFEQPPTHKEYFEDPRLNRQMILTTRVGRAAYQQLIRQGQDHYVVGNQDPAYPDPQFHGIPVTRVSTMETALVYDDGNSGVTSEDLADLKGPRFIWLNGNYLFPVFHDQMYFKKKKPTAHHNVDDTWVCPVATWYNILCTSRMRQGFISPSTDLYY